MNDSITVLTVAGGLATGSAALISAIATRKKILSDNETATKSVGATVADIGARAASEAVKVVQSAMEVQSRRIDSQEKRVAELELLLNVAMEHVKRCEDELTSLRKK